AADQQRLADVLRGLATRRVAALLSNSDCAATRELYRGFTRIDSVPARRAINSVGHGRGPVDELLVRSFDYPVATAPRMTTLIGGIGIGNGLRRRSAGRSRG